MIERESEIRGRNFFVNTFTLLIRYVTRVFMPLMTAADSDINSSSFADCLANYSLTSIMLQTISPVDYEMAVPLPSVETRYYSTDEYADELYTWSRDKQSYNAHIHIQNRG